MGGNLELTTNQLSDTKNCAQVQRWNDDEHAKNDTRAVTWQQIWMRYQKMEW